MAKGKEKKVIKKNCGIQQWPKEKKKRLHFFFHELWPW
jgi:hypothetical protein